MALKPSWAFRLFELLGELLKKKKKIKKDLFSIFSTFSYLFGLYFLGFLEVCKVPGRFRKVRETHSFHVRLVAYLKTSVVASYDQKTKTKKTDVFLFLSFLLLVVGLLSHAAPGSFPRG